MLSIFIGLNMTAGYIYLLEELGFDNNPTGLYKVGKTTAPTVENRTRNYKTGNPRPMIQYHVVYVNDCSASENAIKYYYREFKIVAGGGVEWFQFSPDDLESVVLSMDNEAMPVVAAGFQEQAQWPVSFDYEQSDYSYDDSSGQFVWVIGVIVFLVVGAFVFAQFKGNVSRSTVETTRVVFQDPIKGCPPENQPCRAAYIRDDANRIIGQALNNTTVTTVGPIQNGYIHIRLTNGGTGRIWADSLR
jgi:T5orf172 domain